MDDDLMLSVPSDSFEYFCRDCNQLRLHVGPHGTRNPKCGNCSSTNLVIGELGSLDKQKLMKENAQ